jgi:hypothetical protein
MHVRRLTRALGAAAGALWLLNAACAGEDHPAAGLLLAALAPATCTEYLAAVESSMRFDANLSTPGASPAVTFEMNIPGFATTILLTRQVVLTLPAAFGFAGFDALGAGAQIGQWDFDYTNPNNGVFDPTDPRGYDYRIPNYATGADTAYADTRLNGSYDAGIDSTGVHSIGPGGTHVFTLTLPSGGTNNNGAGGNCSYFDTDTRFALKAGIVQLPQTPGSYDVTVVATSVDPDTGDADDQQGTPPTVYQRTIRVTVPEPGASALGLGVCAALAALRRRRATPRAR